MDKRYSKLIEIAHALKPAFQELRAFHVSAIFKKNQLIAIGTNTRKTHPKAIEYGYPFPQEATHAETLACIRGRRENYMGYDLITIRVDNNNLINNSRPCQFCARLATQYMGFDNVYFSNQNGMMEKYE